MSSRKASATNPPQSPQMQAPGSSVVPGAASAAAPSSSQHRPPSAGASLNSMPQPPARPHVASPSLAQVSSSQTPYISPPTFLISIRSPADVPSGLWQHAVCPRSSHRVSPGGVVAAFCCRHPILPDYPHRIDTPLFVPRRAVRRRRRPAHDVG